MKRIVIVGAGFGGIACARSLLQLNTQLEITLIDRNPYHTVHGNIYEVAAQPTELGDLKELKTTVEIPLKEIFRGKKINLITGTAEFVDTVKREVKVNNQNVQYDYLVMSQGAVPNYYNIPGAAEYGFPMHTAPSALRIRNAIEQAITAERFKATKPIINIVVAGGGVAGVEIAAELQGFIRFVAWQNDVPLNKIRTVLLERAPTLLCGFNPVAGKVATRRLKDLGVNISCNSSITNISSSEINLEDGTALRYEVLIWTAGVVAAPVLNGLNLEAGKGGRIIVDKHFRSTTDKNIFVLGDQCCYTNESGEPLPGTAAQALNQGRYVAYAIGQLQKNVVPVPHVCKVFPVLIPLGKKWGIYSKGVTVVSGYLPYLLRRLVWLHYFISLIGLRRGIHWAVRSNVLYSRNN